MKNTEIKNIDNLVNIVTELYEQFHLSEGDTECYNKDNTLKNGSYGSGLLNGIGQSILLVVETSLCQIYGMDKDNFPWEGFFEYQNLKYDGTQPSVTEQEVRRRIIRFIKSDDFQP